MAKLYLGTTEITPAIYTDHEMYGATINTFFNKVDNQGYLLMPDRTTNLVFDGVLYINNQALDYAFAYKFNVVSIAFPDLISVNCNYALSGLCYNNQYFVSISMPKVENIDGVAACQQMLSNTAVEYVVCDELVSVTGQNAFRQFAEGDTQLKTVDFKKLSYIPGSSTFYRAFYNCPRLENVYFRGLKSTSFGTTNINQIQSLFSTSTGSLTDSGKVTLHFPSNLETIMTGQTILGYPYYGGSSSNVQTLFDLPATE